MRFRGLAIGVFAGTFALCSAPEIEPALAQVGAGAGGFVVPGMPQGVNIPNAGDWAQVLTVTDKWLVLQNASGQQFPVATDSIRLFLMRWPTSPERLSNRSVIEVTGLDLGSYRVQASHIDIFEGASTQLVTPALYRITGYGRISTPLSFVYDFGVYGEPIPGLGPTIMLPGEGNLPARLHAVGPVVNQVPLRVMAPGNSVITIVPSPAGLAMTQITPGTVSLVRPGDMAYFVPVAATAKSLGLGQLVVYKNVPFGG
jgi:hypothetical protein